MGRFLLSFFAFLFFLMGQVRPASAQCAGISGLPDTIEACKYTTLTLSPTITTTGGATPLDTTWTPATGLSNPNIINPVVTLGTASVKYVLEVPAISATNLVVNGNFSSGNTGFTSSYTVPTLPYGTWGPLSNPATYAITTNPHLVHTNFAIFSDHTGDVAGLMMVMNGASSASTPVWCQTIPVVPNTDYDFSAWGASCVGDNPAILQFNINGVLMGTPLALPTTTGVWTPFHAVWNSGSNTTASICIIDQQTAGGGNDFALDDIAFRQVCTVKDSVYIRVANLTPAIQHQLKKGCTADTVQLTALNGAGTAPGSITWFFGDGTTGTGATTSHVYNTQGIYTIKLLTQKGDCKDSAQITINTLHPLSASFTVDDDTVCLGTPVTVNSTSTVSGPATYLFDFADGFTSSSTTAVHSYSLPGSFNIMHIAKDTLQCADTAYHAVYVWPAPVYDTNVSVSICAGTSYYYGGTSHTASGDYPNTFISGKGCDSPMILHLTVLPLSASTLNSGFCQGSSYSYAGTTYTAAGTYPVVFTAANGCDSTVTLTLEQWPVTTKTLPVNICQGSSFSFAGNNYSTAGNYTHVFSSAKGCDSTVTLVLSVNPPPRSDVYDTICAGQVYHFDGSNYTLPGNYSHNIKSGDCDSIVTLHLFVNEVPFLDFNLSQAGCQGEVQTLQLSRTFMGVGGSYGWDFGGGEVVYGMGGGPFGIRWQDAGWHTVTFHGNLTGCGDVFASDSIYINPRPELHILSLTDAACTLDTITINTTYRPGYTYQWLPAGWLVDQSGGVARVRIQRSDWITVGVVDEHGCTNTDRVYVGTENCCTLELPTAFTPNGDGRNDVFQPVTRGHQEIATFRVVNRWGQTIYESQAPTAGWDGTYKGVLQDMGTYMYYLKYRCTDGHSYEKQGEVTLVR